MNYPFSRDFVVDIDHVFDWYVTTKYFWEFSIYCKSLNRQKANLL